MYVSSKFDHLSHIGKTFDLRTQFSLQYGPDVNCGRLVGSLQPAVTTTSICTGTWYRSSTPVAASSMLRPTASYSRYTTETLAQNCCLFSEPSWQK